MAGIAAKQGFDEPVPGAIKNLILFDRQAKVKNINHY